MNFALRFSVVMLTMIIMDVIWLNAIGKEIYINHISDIMLIDHNNKLQLNYLGTIVNYLLIALGILFFVAPKTEGKAFIALLWGGMLGMVIYGAFNFSNLSFIKGWNTSIAIIDTSWGIVLCSIASLALCLFDNKFNLKFNKAPF